MPLGLPRLGARGWRPVRPGHHLVLTGTPASQAMRRELMRLVVLAGGRV